MMDRARMDLTDTQMDHHRTTAVQLAGLITLD